MSKYTTEERRELTKQKPELFTEQYDEVMSDTIETTGGYKIEEDSTNNKIFRTINSELTGLAYEYRYLTGKYHPTLDETEYFYKIRKEVNGPIDYKSYWDSEKLHKAGRLEPGNEFHLNLEELSTVKYPIRPPKYASWVDDTHEFVSDFETTESKMINMIRTLDSWNTSGGGSGTFESSVFGEYKEMILGENDLLQTYMTVGYEEYQSGQNNDYMDAGFNKTGEIILIGDDNENFSFGVVINSREKPSRILFSSYGKVGTVPDNASITSTFVSGQSINNSIAESIIFSLKEHYSMVKHYLDFNPRKSESNNAEALESVEYCLKMINKWEQRENRSDFSSMLYLLDAIEGKRDSTFVSNRVSYINTYLSSANQLYDDRFNIIDVRLSKNMGTLKDYLIIEKNSELITSIFDDKRQSRDIYSKLFISKEALKDGDYHMRIYVANDDGLKIGDICYILTNDSSVKEVRAKISNIEDGKVPDVTKPIGYDKNGNIELEDMDCKEIFFYGEIFGKEYKTSDNFRIIKEIE